MKKKALEPILARITRPEVSLSMTIFYYKLRRLDKCTMQPGVIYTTLIKRNVLHFVWLPCLNEISLVLSTADNYFYTMNFKPVKIETKNPLDASE